MDTVEPSTEIKPCRKCGARDRYKNGNCRPCVLAYMRRRTNNPEVAFEPCHTCGARDRYKSGACRPCQIAASKRHYRNNSEKIRQRHQDYYEKQAAKAQSDSLPCSSCGAQDRNRYGQCKPCKVRATKRYREANPESDRSYREANKEKIRLYCEVNKEKRYEHQRRWRQSNPGKVRVKNHRYRAREAGAETTTDPREIQFLAHFHDLKCRMNRAGAEFHVDHVDPISRGGADQLLNLRIVSGSENSAKCDRVLDREEIETLIVDNIEDPLYGAWWYCRLDRDVVEVRDEARRILQARGLLAG